MELATAVASVAGVSSNDVMLLRHSSNTVAQLLRAGATIAEYTEVQPIGSKYDYLDEEQGAVSVVVVIVNDRVHGIFRVLGVQREGTTYSLTSAAHRHFDEKRGKKERPARRYRLEAIPTDLVGAAVHGWESRERTAVQRSGGGFFHAIEVDAPDIVQSDEELRASLERGVVRAMRDPPELRRQRLVSAPVQAKAVRVVTTAYLRNPDVVAEVLLRAAGVCELCGVKAPFLRRSDGTPYLEVHHRVRLADGGADTVQNAVAACPNCHRHEHYG